MLQKMPCDELFRKIVRLNIESHLTRLLAKSLCHRKGFLLENITNLAHSYLKNLCVSSNVEPISKNEIKERLKSLRYKSKSGIFSLDEFERLDSQFDNNNLLEFSYFTEILISRMNDKNAEQFVAEHISGFIVKRLEKHCIKAIYANLEAKLQDIKSQIKIKENALKEASLLYDLQMAKIQAILNKIKD